MELVLIPAGRFTMGSNEYEREKPRHEVTISKPFYLGKYQVTQEQWQAVMRGNPSYFKGARNPVDAVSWDDCMEFCKKLSAKGGLALRLPTEAEWEYACRAGTSGPYAGTGELDEMGWFADNSGDNRLDSQHIWNTDSTHYAERLVANRCRTHPVGQKHPNGWGLYDMHGNVYEWCADWYGAYSSNSETDPTGVASGDGHVLRGGAWFNLSHNCRTTGRNDRPPSVRYNDYGFRLVLESNTEVTLELPVGRYQTPSGRPMRKWIHTVPESKSDQLYDELPDEAKRLMFGIPTMDIVRDTCQKHVSGLPLEKCIGLLFDVIDYVMLQLIRVGDFPEAIQDTLQVDRATALTIAARIGRHVLVDFAKIQNIGNVSAFIDEWD